MRRAPIVLSSTAAGLALVLGFHTHATQGIHLGTASASGTTPSGGTGGSSTTASTTPGATSTTTASSATAASSTRSATGQFIQYRYGDIQLRVTASGTRITKVAILQEDATDPRSQEINSQAIPMLQDQTMSAQSSTIDGVSGATYTSEAYYQSLQSALDQLGIK